MIAAVLENLFAMYQRYRSLALWDKDKNTNGSHSDSGTLPIPPRNLRMLVAGTPDEDVFLELGR
jgi:hypothetical protein